MWPTVDGAEMILDPAYEVLNVPHKLVCSGYINVDFTEAPLYIFKSTIVSTVKLDSFNTIG